jgi:hypothetical protein
MERVGRQGPLAVAAGGEGWEAGTAVGAVVVAGGEGWEAGAIVVAVGRVGRQHCCRAQPLLPSSELRRFACALANKPSDTSRCNPTSANGMVSITIFVDESCE